jgi:hypothetical protein
LQQQRFHHLPFLSVLKKLSWTVSYAYMRRDLDTEANSTGCFKALQMWGAGSYPPRGWWIEGSGHLSMTATVLGASCSTPLT